MIPFGNVILTLVALISPLALGMLIRYRWPESNKYLAKIIVPFTVCTILFMLTAGVYVNQGGNSIDFKTSPKSS